MAQLWGSPIYCGVSTIAVGYARHVYLPLRLKYSTFCTPRTSNIEQTSKTMTDLSELAKRLQEQVDVITKHLEKEKLPAPSFIPSASEDPLKSTMQSLPADVDKARKKAQALSWSITQLLSPPSAYLSWTILQVPTPIPFR